ncbi:MAG: hypothetical protein FWE31_01090 [Firmicutes bacterium]|nr:hypothetical protein [Bacillota bacterium]
MENTIIHDRGQFEMRITTHAPENPAVQEHYVFTFYDKTKDKVMLERIILDEEYAKETLVKSFDKNFEKMESAVSEKQKWFFYYDKFKRVNRTIDALADAWRTEKNEKRRANIKRGFRAEHALGVGPVVGSDDNLAGDIDGSEICKLY